MLVTKWNMKFGISFNVPCAKFKATEWLILIWDCHHHNYQNHDYAPSLSSINIIHNHHKYRSHPLSHAGPYYLYYKGCRLWWEGHRNLGPNLTPSRLHWHCYLWDGYYVLKTIIVNKDLLLLSFSNCGMHMIVWFDLWILSSICVYSFLLSLLQWWSQSPPNLYLSNHVSEHTKAAIKSINFLRIQLHFMFAWKYLMQ